MREKAPAEPGMSRRRVLTASAGTAAAAAAGGLVARQYVASATPSSAAPGASGLIETVLEAFGTYRLVGLGESHQLQEHHDLLQTLLADPRLPEVVDDIVVEFGNALYQDLIDRFVLGGEPVNDAALRLVWRNTTQSPEDTWDAPVYEQFYRRVRAVNRTLPPARRIRVLAGDPPVEWSNSGVPNAPYRVQRDPYAASVVAKEVLAKGHRALLHYGSGHVIHESGWLVGIIEQQTGVRTYTITDLVPLAGDPGGLGVKLSGYPRNTVIPTAGTWLGEMDAGDVLALEVLRDGGKPVNPDCGILLGTLTDAGLYLGQPAVLTESWPNPAIYLDPAYWAELQRRNAATGGGVDLDSLRQQQPPTFQLADIPGCGA
jgi:hypothetical protein